MKTYIIQTRLGPNEFFITVDTADIGSAIILAGEYLADLDPDAIFNIYSVRQSSLHIVLEDIFLN